jgi:hypothetical protein
MNATYLGRLDEVHIYAGQDGKVQLEKDKQPGRVCHNPPYAPSGRFPKGMDIWALSRPASSLVDFSIGVSAKPKLHLKP